MQGGPQCRRLRCRLRLATAAAAHLLQLLLLLRPGLAAMVKPPPQPSYPLLALHQEWVPNGPLPSWEGSTTGKFAQFAVAGLWPVDEQGRVLNQTLCRQTPFDTRQLPVDLLLRLHCVAASPAAPDPVKFEDLWKTGGACTGWSMLSYFEAIAELFAVYDANAALQNVKFPETDRAEVQGLAREAWGAEPTVLCAPQQQDGAAPLVGDVILYLNSSTLQPVDAPFSRNSSLPGSLADECQGELQLQPGPPAPRFCQADFPAQLLGSVDSSAAAPAPAQAASLDPAGVATCRQFMSGINAPLKLCAQDLQTAQQNLIAAEGNTSNSPYTPADCTYLCEGNFQGMPTECVAVGEELRRLSYYSGPELSQGFDLCRDLFCEGGSCSVTAAKLSSARTLLDMTTVDWPWNAVGLGSAQEPATAPAAAASSPSSSGGSGGLSSGAIAGIAVAACTVVALAGLVVWRSRQRKQVAAAAAAKAAAGGGGGKGGRPSPAQLEAGSPFAGTLGPPSSAAERSQGEQEEEEDCFLTFARRYSEQALELNPSLRLSRSMPLPALLPPIPSEPSDGSGSAPIPSPASVAGPAGLNGAVSLPPGSPLAAFGAGAFGGLLAPGGSHSTSGGISATPSLAPQYPGLLFDIPFTDLVLHRKVGTGGFGAVYCADWHMSTVAVKVLLSHGTLSDQSSLAVAVNQTSPLVQRLREEASIMLSMRHPNVVALLGTCSAPPCIVTEYCSRGSVTDCLRAAQRDPQLAAALTWHLRLSLALDGAKGMLHLHTRGIVHRDLKGPNLLIDAHWSCKIVDFGLSKFIDEMRGSGASVVSSTEVTNPRWLPPEVLQGLGTSLASDVYAFGVVLWELLVWEVPYGTVANPWAIAKSIMAGERLPVPEPERLPGPDALPPAQLEALLSVMRRCWLQAPEARPGFQQVAAELRDILRALEAAGFSRSRRRLNV